MTFTGDGLNIVIACDYVPHHNWMAFICWYSISKNLPDAKVSIFCHRRIMKFDLFDWSRKCKIPFVLHSPSDTQGQLEIIKQSANKPVLVVYPESVCIRDFDEAQFDFDIFLQKEIYISDNNLCCDCKEENNSSVFVTYNHGWGKFVTSNWINKMTSPFIFGVKYNKGEVTSSEVRIGKLWNSATTLFQTISRG